MRLFHWLAIYTLLAGLACAPSPPTHEPGGPYYFAGFHYGPYFYPANELPRDAALARDLYIEAYYDPSGRLTRVVKFMRGRPTFEIRYFYTESGEFEREEVIHHDPPSEPAA